MNSNYGKFSERLSQVENALFELHHGTLEEIAHRAKLPTYSIEPYLQTLILFHKADCYDQHSGDNPPKIYQIIEHDYSPESED